ncbi:hypothetical protein ABZ678_14340, partial [Streptomyces hirsutus]|uniref:hypothetical protein n=1 Tax=Streptomyces hirsutus TaxID=35620 RepID=UPI00340EE419
GTCTGLITVQEGGPRAGQVDYTVEYYTTGHLSHVRGAVAALHACAGGPGEGLRGSLRVRHISLITDH